jgi:hypothetical protein
MGIAVRAIGTILAHWVSLLLELTRRWNKDDYR